MSNLEFIAFRWSLVVIETILVLIPLMIMRPKREHLSLRIIGCLAVLVLLITGFTFLVNHVLANSESLSAIGAIFSVLGYLIFFIAFQLMTFFLIKEDYKRSFYDFTKS